MIKPGRFWGRAGDLSIRGRSKAPCNAHHKHRASTGMWDNGDAQAQATSTHWACPKIQVSSSKPHSWGDVVNTEAWMEQLQHTQGGPALTVCPSQPKQRCSDPAKPWASSSPWYPVCTKAMLLRSQFHLHLCLSQISHANELNYVKREVLFGFFDWVYTCLVRHAGCGNPRSAAAQDFHDPFSGTGILSSAPHASPCLLIPLKDFSLELFMPGWRG